MFSFSLRITGSTLQDSSVCRRMLGKVLQSLSITYDEAEDGAQAVEKIQLSLSSLKKRTSSTASLPETNIREASNTNADRKRFDLILVRLLLFLDIALIVTNCP